MMRLGPNIVFALCIVQFVTSYRYDNYTENPARWQLDEFRHEHPVPIGLLTTSAGTPVEIRDTVTINSDSLINRFQLDRLSHSEAQRIPERVVHAKGVPALGYFEVTNDVSKYTSADVFNGVGKKTPLVVRLSTTPQNIGGSELIRELKGFAVKFYTKDGNLDLLCLNTPVFGFNDPLVFPNFVHSFRRNPQTNIFDSTMRWDLIVLQPSIISLFLWLQSDIGIPKGFRAMDAFPIHVFELSNKHGERHYVKFNFRTEQGLSNLTSSEAMGLRATDPEFFPRDLYNAIKQKNYPSWRLDMEVMSFADIQKLDYNPFDVTRLWKRGTFHTVTIGRLVLNQEVDNQFRYGELSAFRPSNLVPGIPGPTDFLFKGRRTFYRDTQNYRLGTSHNKIDVNLPIYAKTYNRDGKQPLKSNMGNAPNYYPNSFNGPMPFVDEKRPVETLLMLRSHVVDFQPMKEFYNEILESDEHRQRLANNLATSLETVIPDVVDKALKLLSMIDSDLGWRTKNALNRLHVVASKRTEPVYKLIEQCIARDPCKYRN